MLTEPGIEVPWRSFPGSGTNVWIVMLGEGETLETKPAWLNRLLRDGTAILVAPRGSGPMAWSDPAPYYVQRSLPLLGRTVDSCRLLDFLVVASDVLDRLPESHRATAAGRGQAGVMAAYAALLEPRLSEVTVLEPPSSHRDGPIFLHVLRVLDVPEALGLLAPRPLHVETAQPSAFARTRQLYEVGGGTLKLGALP